MPTTSATQAAPTEFEGVDPTDPRISGKDPTMVPGHPLCNYAKFMAAQPTVDLYVPGDPSNPHIKDFTVGFNSYRATFAFNKTIQVPRPLAEQILLGGKATTTNAAVLKSLAGQIFPPKEGPQPGPISGDYADARF